MNKFFTDDLRATASEPTISLIALLCKIAQN